MPSAYDLKMLFNAPRGSKGREAINYILRRYIPGHDAMLDVMARLHEAQHGRPRPDPMLQDMLDKLRSARDKSADAILAGRLEHGVLQVDFEPGVCISIHVPHAGGATREEPTPPPAPASTPPPEDDRTAMLGTMPDTSLAALWGVSHTAVAKMRRKRGIKPYSAKARIDWGKWDGQLRDADMTPEGLAGLIGCDVSTVTERLRLLRGDTGSKYRGGAPLAENRVNYAQVDWSKANSTLARELGVTRQTIMQQRKRHAPK